MPKRRWLCSLQVVPAILAFAAPAAAGVFSVGSGNSFDLGSNTLDLGCSDLDVGGTFAVNTGIVNGANDVAVIGTLLGGSGEINLAGDWHNNLGGVFTAGSGSVTFSDGCGTITSQIWGSNTFYDLTVSSSSGKFLEFESGALQTITQTLALAGVEGALLVVRGTSGLSQPLIDAQGSADVDFVFIDNFDATANPIVLGPNTEVREPASTFGVELCGDITGDLAFDSLDVDQARNHLTDLAVVGDITLCNVIGPHDSGGSGNDCGVDDVSLLRRKLAGEPGTLVNGCQP